MFQQSLSTGISSGLGVPTKVNSSQREITWSRLPRPQKFSLYEVFEYDALGRLETQQLGGISYFTTKDVTNPYDSLQRLTHYQNALGAYQTSFVSGSNRVQALQTCLLYTSDAADD